MSLYDHPEIYDIVFDGDSRAQQEFLVGCFQRYARRAVDRVLEPGCGTGRLLVRLAALGYRVVGVDRNAKAVDYCRERLRRARLSGSVEVGDMAAMDLSGPVDAAFNLINTFRHLTSDGAATAHLRCVAKMLAPGGIYVLGLHLLPEAGRVSGEEIETRRSGDRIVRSRIWSISIDRLRREERIGVAIDVTGPAGRSRIDDEFVFRTYSWHELLDVIHRAGGFDLLALHDFDYDLEEATPIEARSEAIVIVLARR